MDIENAFVKVDKLIKPQEVSNLLMELLRIEGHKESKDDELTIAKYINNFFKNKLIDSKLEFVTDKRPNVYARIGKSTVGKNLMLNGHIDTVPSYNMKNAFNPKIKENTIFGRGAADMKGAITAMMIAMAAVKKSAIKLDGELIFTGVIDEEQRCIGAKKIVEDRHPLTDFAIVGEPTNLKLMIGHKGMEWIEIIVEGQSSHGSTPDEGINAISNASKLIEKIESALIPELKKRYDDILGCPTLNIGVINGGNDPNVVPNLCKIQIDRRWVPSESTASMQKDFKKIIEEIQYENPLFKANVRRMSEATGTHVPLKTPCDHFFVKELVDGMEYLFPENSKVGVFEGWSDGAQLDTVGITSVVCGPGDIKFAHANNEQIDLREVIEAARYYAFMALKICL